MQPVPLGVQPPGHHVGVWHAKWQFLVQRVVGEVMQRHGGRQRGSVVRRRVREACDGVLLPSQVHVIVYPLQRHAWMLGLERYELPQGGHVGRLVGGHWWRGWVQDVMVAGDDGGECLVGDGKLLHGTCLNQRGWEAAERVVLSTEHH